MANHHDASGNVIRSVDKINNLEYRAGFDSLGRLASKDVFDLTATGRNDKWSRSVEYQYDKLNNISKLSLAYSNGTSNTVHYMYNTAKLPSTVILPSNKNVNYNYDGLNRLTSTSINTPTPITAQYTYMPTARGSSLYTTNLISTEVTDAFAYSYIYDLNGNITSIQNGIKQSDDSYTYGSSSGNKYTYDQYNQLIRDLDNDNGTSTHYAYDTNGNITRRIINSWNVSGNYPIANLSTDNFTYADTKGWGDLLTAYNGQTITYDGIGNPLTYRDGITMTWQNGRQLATLTNEDEGLAVTYTYDPSGLRTQKAVTGGITTKYIYEGGLLVRMSYGSSIFDFNYDANDRPIGFKYSPAGSTTGTYYYYGVNARGDIEALYNGSGIQIASYSYDAYGKPISTNTLLGGHSTVIAVQPLRYRGYVYDTETGFYYLQSRYYDPTTCRFVNGDSQLNTDSINGFNQFAYCNNNPIAGYDPTGKAQAIDYAGGFPAPSGFYYSSSGGAGGGANLLAGMIIGAAVFAPTVSHLSDGMRAEKFLVLAFVETATEVIKETTPVYYGADLSGVGDTLNYITPPMDFITAAAWATATATAHTYVRNESWGLYTKDREDAYAIALFLGGNLPTEKEVHGNGRSGYYYHYHTYDHKFMGYKHFHLWYGNPT